MKSNINYKELSDTKLLEITYQKVYQEAISELFIRYQHLIYGVCLKHTKSKELSEDLTQNVYEHLLEKLPSQKIENFKPWLFRVTYNICMLHFRKAGTDQKKLEIYKEDSLFVESESSFHLIDENEEIEQKENNLNDCIERLNEFQKKCIELFYLNEKCYKEIEELTGYALKKIKSYIQNGKRNLKLCLENKNG